MFTLKPHTTFHSAGSNTGKMMGEASARLTLVKFPKGAAGEVPANTDEECFAALEGLIAYAAAKKLPLAPGSTAFIDEPFVKRSAAQVLKLTVAAQKSGLNCWVSKRGNLTVGSRPEEGAKPAAKATREVDPDEDAALAAFMSKAK